METFRWISPGVYTHTDLIVKRTVIMQEDLLRAASGNQLSQEPGRDDVVRLDRKVHSL